MKTGAASSSGVFYEAFCGDAAKYEALCVLHASGVSSAQKHEAALRAMKQRLTASFAIYFAHLGKKNGGERGIRTLGTHKDTTVFETAAFDHSAISPLCYY